MDDFTATSATYKAALFDLDGTLVDSTVPIIESTEAALAELGWRRVPREVIAAHIGYKLEAIFPEKSLEERKHLIEVIGRHYTDICADKTVLYPGMGALVGQLAGAGVPLGIVTSKKRGHTEQILSALQVRDRFGVVIGYDDVSTMKPDPEGLFKAAELLGVAVSDCLYIGDTVVDVQTARAAGMAIAGVAWGTDGLEPLKNAGIDHEIPDPGALPALF